MASKNVTIQPVPPPLAKPKYTMPRPLGPIVEWRHAAGEPPQYAIVTKLGKSAISVALVVPDSRAVLPQDGVRHISDPSVASQITDGGVWDYTDHDRLLMRVLPLAEQADPED